MGQQLTDSIVRRLPLPERSSHIYFDDKIGSFGVRITPKGARSFVLDYRIAGRQRRMTIGQFPTWSVAAARKRAEELRREVDRGNDPLGDRQDARRATEAAQRAPRFGDVVDDYIERHQVGTKGNVSAPEVRRLLLRECSPWLDRPVASIEPREVRTLVESIRDGKVADGSKSKEPRPYLANRTFAHLRTLFRWCAEPGIEYVERSPCEGLRRPFDGEEARDRWFSDDEIIALWQAATELEPYSGAYLKLLLLSGKRKGALAAMRHEEIDFDKAKWTPPRDPRRRRRNKRVHVYPLPDLAARILLGLSAAEDNPYVFVGRYDRGHLNAGTPLQRRISELSGIGDFHFHAIRHTVETRLGELGVPPHIRDVALDHAPARGAGAGYDHYDYLAETRRAFQDWSDRILELVEPEGVRLLR